MELDKYLAAQLVDKASAWYEALLDEILTALNRQDELLPRLEELRRRTRGTSTSPTSSRESTLAERLDDARFMKVSVLSTPEALGLASISRRQGDYAEWLESGGRAFWSCRSATPHFHAAGDAAEFQEASERFRNDLAEMAKNEEQVAGVLGARPGSVRQATQPDLRAGPGSPGMVAEAKREPTTRFTCTNTRSAHRTCRRTNSIVSLESAPHRRQLRQSGRDLPGRVADHPSLEPARPSYVAGLTQSGTGRTVEAAVEAIRERGPSRRKTAASPFRKPGIFHVRTSLGRCHSGNSRTSSASKDDEETVLECLL
ncbi:MAG: hypothetical protein R3B90_04885 [Planctomycetaceae bacterium]